MELHVDLPQAHTLSFLAVPLMLVQTGAVQVLVEASQRRPLNVVQPFDPQMHGKSLTMLPPVWTHSGAAKQMQVCELCPHGRKPEYKLPDPLWK